MDSMPLPADRYCCWWPRLLLNILEASHNPGCYASLAAAFQQSHWCATRWPPPYRDFWPSRCPGKNLLCRRSGRVASGHDQPCDRFSRVLGQYVRVALRATQRYIGRALDPSHDRLQPRLDLSSADDWRSRASGLHGRLDYILSGLRHSLLRSRLLPWQAPRRLELVRPDGTSNPNRTLARRNPNPMNAPNHAMQLTPSRTTFTFYHD